MSEVKIEIPEAPPPKGGIPEDLQKDIASMLDKLAHATDARGFFMSLNKQRIAFWIVLGIMALGTVVIGPAVTSYMMRSDVPPVVKDEADTKKIVEAVKELGDSQAINFRKLEMLIIAPRPVPVPPAPVPPDGGISVQQVVTAPVGQLTRVPVSSSVPLTWWVQPPHEKAVVADDKQILVVPTADATFYVVAMGDINGKVTYRQVEVRAGKGPQPPPDPKPPEPKPPTPPDPPKPPEPKDDPILGDGFRVLIIRETGKPTKHDNSIYSEELFNYLKAKTKPTTDGAKRGWYIADKDTDFGADSKIWSNAINRKGTTIPWAIVSAPGKGSYEGPYPDSHADAMKLFKKYGGD